MLREVENRHSQRSLSIWNSNYILLLQGQLVSVFGNTIYDTALRFWIIATTGSTALMGAVLGAALLPGIIISPFAGTFIDRHHRKSILIAADLVSGICILLIGIAAKMGFAKVWMVLTAGIIAGICSCFFNPTIDSTIPDIVPKSKLIKANSTLSMVNTGNDIAGYAFGSMLVQVLGAPVVFISNGISFLFSAASECFIKIPPVEKLSNKTNFWQDMKEGIGFIKRTKGIKNLFIAIAFLNFCASMSMTLTLPWFKVSNGLGLRAYGISMAVNTLGTFLGYTYFSIFEIKKNKRFRAFIASGMTISGTMLLYSLSLNFYFIVVLFFINGFSLALLGTLLQSAMQNCVPSTMRSKAFAFKRTLTSSLMPLGMVIAGILGEKIKMNMIIFGDYFVVLVLFVYLSSLRSVREVINK